MRESLWRKEKARRKNQRRNITMERYERRSRGPLLKKNDKMVMDPDQRKQKNYLAPMGKREQIKSALRTQRRNMKKNRKITPFSKIFYLH